MIHRILQNPPGYPALHPGYSGPRIAAIHGLFAR